MRLAHSLVFCAWSVVRAFATICRMVVVGDGRSELVRNAKGRGGGEIPVGICLDWI